MSAELGSAGPAVAGPAVSALTFQTFDDALAQEARFDSPSALALLLATVAGFHPDLPAEQRVALERAFALAQTAHAAQTRRSGAPYFTHPAAVAQLVAELGLDAASVTAALLHDTVEDTPVTLDDLHRELAPIAGEAFAETVTRLVDGLTKLERIKADSAASAAAASLRKLLVALAADPRVLVVKLADRLHNCRTLGAVPPAKAARTAQETLDVYAPLAHRLGMGEIKWQLEDLSFAVLHPDRYAELTAMLAARAPSRDAHAASAVRAVSAALDAAGIAADVSGRAKHLWSIYSKMVVRGKSFDDIHDLVGVRVIVPELRDCYAALGVLHGMWTPVPGRFKDYIALPKFNLYQSLHLTAVDADGSPVEVQIRTRQMHERAERGIASHWSYKGASRGEVTTEPAWLARLLDWGEETSDPAAFLAGVREDLAAGEVWVLTPKGDVVTLPAGATALDFAYAIHTEVGHRTMGTRVNGKLVALSTRLAPGDAVEVLTARGPDAGPRAEWLDAVTTAKARARIRQYLARERREDQADAGRDELAKALRAEGLPSARLARSAQLLEVAVALHCPDLDALHVAIGSGRISARQVAGRLRSMLSRGSAVPDTEQLPAVVGRAVRPRQAGRGGPSVHVEGLDDVLVHLAACCTPVPGDHILGYVTRGRGVSVHRTDCTNAAPLAGSGRTVEVEWVATTRAPVRVTLRALDRPRLLADVTAVLADCGVNIVSSRTSTDTEHIARESFEFIPADPGHLERVLAALRAVDGVFSVDRDATDPPVAAS